MDRWTVKVGGVQYLNMDLETVLGNGSTGLPKFSDASRIAILQAFLEQHPADFPAGSVAEKRVREALARLKKEAVS